MKRRFCVLFQWRVPFESNCSMLIEQLRYAGVVGVVKEDTEESGAINYMLQITAPYGSPDGGRHWAHTQAERMKTFGINAVDTFAS